MEAAGSGRPQELPGRVAWLRVCARTSRLSPLSGTPRPCPPRPHPCSLSLLLDMLNACRHVSTGGPPQVKANWCLEDFNQLLVPRWPAVSSPGLPGLCPFFRTSPGACCPQCRSRAQQLHPRCPNSALTRAPSAPAQTALCAQRQSGAQMSSRCGSRMWTRLPVAHTAAGVGLLGSPSPAQVVPTLAMRGALAPAAKPLAAAPGAAVPHLAAGREAPRDGRHSLVRGPRFPL